MNFILQNNPNALTMIFKANKNAEDLYKKSIDADGRFIDCEDDFGCKLRIDMKFVAAVTFSEYEKDLDKNGDLMIIQQKAQLKTQQKARTDVGLQIMVGTPDKVTRQ